MDNFAKPINSTITMLLKDCNNSLASKIDNMSKTSKQNVSQQRTRQYWLQSPNPSLSRIPLRNHPTLSYGLCKLSHECIIVSSIVTSNPSHLENWWVMIKKSTKAIPLKAPKLHIQRPLRYALPHGYQEGRQIQSNQSVGQASWLGQKVSPPSAIVYNVM